jgi:hypothetical protein
VDFEVEWVAVKRLVEWWTGQSTVHAVSAGTKPRPVPAGGRSKVIAVIELH